MNKIMIISIIAGVLTPVMLATVAGVHKLAIEVQLLRSEIENIKGRIDATDKLDVGTRELLVRLVQDIATLTEGQRNTHDQLVDIKDTLRRRDV